MLEEIRGTSEVDTEYGTIVQVQGNFLSIFGFCSEAMRPCLSLDRD